MKPLAQCLPQSKLSVIATLNLLLLSLVVDKHLHNRASFPMASLYGRCMSSLKQQDPENQIYQLLMVAC